MVGTYYTVKEVITDNARYSENQENVYAAMVVQSDIQVINSRVCFDTLMLLANVGGVQLIITIAF